MTNIISIKPIGKHQTYDLEVNHKDHQYYLENGILTSNSHATLYSFISYQTAYLKRHFPTFFMTSNLKAEVSSNAKAAKDNINKIKAELRAMNVKLVPPDVNTSNLSWQIINDQTLMAGLDSLKFMGSDAIPELIAKRPFTSFQDLIYRTDASKVRANSIQAMAASGSLDCFGMDRKQMFTYASDYRAKLKAHMSKLDKLWAKEYGKSNNLTLKKGELEWKDNNGNVVVIPTPPENRVSSHLGEFKYPFPEDKSWTLQEMFAFEEYYMGEGISGDKFDHYPKFFDRNKSVPFEAVRTMFPYEQKFDDERNNRKANTYYLGNYHIRPLEAVLTSVFSFVVKKEDSKIFGQEMARITMQDPWGEEATLLCFPEAWTVLRERLKERMGKTAAVEAGLAIRFLGNFQWENDHTFSFVLTDVLDFKMAPRLPEDKKAKKVKMPRGKKVKVEEVEEMSKEELMEELEEEIVDEGFEGVDDED
jgi:DNA polymerase III alpha subunit